MNGISNKYYKLKDRFVFRWHKHFGNNGKWKYPWTKNQQS